MNYLSLYRKYRPKSFADVIGQEYIVKILKNSIKNNQIANAYVFAGTKGTGKTSIAKIYANAINCLQSKDGDVCGQCEVCKDFINNQLMDVIELDAASNNGVDEIRQINDSALFLPAKFGKKVYIIDEAHMLTTQAWNALLKLIEEPPRHVVFIFATTEMHKIPATIISRCQCFRFNKILNSDIIQLLTKVCKAENIKYDSEALKIIADIADGSARDALSILEQTATYSDNNIIANDIYKIYGLLSPKQMIDFINLLSSGKNEDIFAKIDELYQSGVNFASFVGMFVSILTDLLIYLKTNNTKLLTKTNDNLIKSLTIKDISKIIALLDIWQETYFKLSVPTDVHMIVNHLIIKSIDILGVKSETIKKETTKDVKKEEELFVFSDVAIPETKKEPKKETQPKTHETVAKSNDNSMPSNHEILLAVFSNRNKEIESLAADALKQIQNGTLDEKSFSQAQSATRVLCASQNGVILLFNEEVDAKLFNKSAQKADFILSCCKLFKNPKFVVGFTKEQVNQYKSEMLETKKHPKPLLNLSPLRAILNKSSSIEQIAYNTIYSFLEKDDDDE